MPVIRIDKFDGGKNTENHQLLIGTNQVASASKNVWSPEGSLQKTPGMAVLATFTACASGAIDELITDPTINTSYVAYFYMATAAAANSNIYPYATDVTAGTTEPLGYVTGSVSISGASKISATGHSTLWSTHVSAGDRFRVNASADNWYHVSSVEDDTHLTLGSATPVNVASSTASNYLIHPGLISAANKNVYMIPLAGSWWAGGGTGAPLARYDSTGMTRHPSAPNASYFAAHKNYLFGFRTSTAESRLYASKFKDPTSWPTNNFIDIDKERGKGTGIFSFGRELIFFKTGGMYRLEFDVFNPGTAALEVDKIVTPTHFQFNSGKAVAVWNGLLVFHAGGRIYSYETGANSIKEISERFDLDLNIANNLTDISPSDAKIRAFNYGGNVFFKAISGSHTQTGLLDKNGAWWLLSDDESGYLGLGPVAIWPFTSKRAVPVLSDDSGTPRLVEFDIAKHLVGDPANYQKSYVGSSNGSAIAINGTVTTKEINIGYGQFKHLVIYLRKQTAGNLTVEHSIDQDTFTSQTIDMTAGRGSMIRAVLQINRVGSTIQLRLSNNVADQTFEVFGIEIHYEERDENRQR